MKERGSGPDRSKLRTVPLARRENRVQLSDFGTPPEPGASLEQFLDGLGDVLAVRALRGLARDTVAARRAECPVLWALGGHVIKVGLAPTLIRMLERGLLTGLAMNGATAIHDWEIAAIGATSEDVAGGLARGEFGMADETGRELNAAAREARESGRGLGEVLGQRIVESGQEHAEHSLLATAWRLGRPATVHVALGSDVVHQHPSADGADIGAASYADFLRLTDEVSRLAGGVWLNCGSSVQLPEVFLKALAVARNLDPDLGEFTTANLDMLRHYRPQENVLRRPHVSGGRSYELIGHHEINVPLLAAAIEIEWDRTG
ncbi:MAG: hypothetical protein GY716_11500 [bacterium]|nr:hypothetical protein [bacterium]